MQKYWESGVIRVIFLILGIIISKEASTEVFPISTEIQISKIRPLLEHAPKGIYLTVGGERAFRGASLFKGLEHLIVFDISSEIIRFNKINTELLKSANKEVYKQLRWYSDFKAWLAVNKNLTEDEFTWWDENVRNIKGYSLPEELNKYGSAIYNKKYLTIREKLMSFYPALKSKYNDYDRVFLENVSWSDLEPLLKGSKIKIAKGDFEWWDTERKKPESCAKIFIEHPEQAVDLGQILNFRSGNYLFDDELYDKLHNLALSNNITVIQADATQKADLNKIIQAIKNQNKTLSVIDFDNLFIYNYMGEGSFRKALADLVSYGKNDSRLILMHNYKNYACGQFQIYLGFTFENYKKWPQENFFHNFLNHLPPDLAHLIDGRLYEGNDRLPI